MRDDLIAFAWKIWIVAHVDYESQRILRDVAPNAYWDVFAENFADGGTLRKGRFVYPSRILTKTLIQAIVRRLTGRPISIHSERPLGIAAGGVVITLLGNESISIVQDPGHCVRIWSGPMYTEERRIREVYQEPVNLTTVTTQEKLKNYLELNDIVTPVNEFGDGQYSHIAQIKGDMAAVAAILSFPKKKIHIDLLKAIDNANGVDARGECLVKCAAGKLTDEEIEKIWVVGPTNYGGYGKEKLGVSGAKRPVVLAHRNMLLQRAIVSNLQLGQGCVVNLGDCLHCAVRDIIARPTTLLIA